MFHRPGPPSLGLGLRAEIRRAVYDCPWQEVKGLLLPCTLPAPLLVPLLMARGLPSPLVFRGSEQRAEAWKLA